MIRGLKEKLRNRRLERLARDPHVQSYAERRATALAIDLATAMRHAENISRMKANRRAHNRMRNKIARLSRRENR